jgi:hypothetical protein
LASKIVVAEEFEDGSVESVRTRFGGDIDLAGRASEFSRINAGLNLKFGERIDGGQENVAVEVGVGILDAVEGEAIVFAPLAGDADVLFRSLAALKTSLLSGCPEAKADVRTKRDKLQKVSAVQR